VGAALCRDGILGSTCNPPAEVVSNWTRLLEGTRGLTRHLAESHIVFRISNLSFYITLSSDRVLNQKVAFVFLRRQRYPCKSTLREASDESISGYDNPGGVPDSTTKGMLFTTIAASEIPVGIGQSTWRGEQEDCAVRPS
jgi:hypothetical protein